MKLAILSRNSKLYSTRRLVEAARQRGHTVRVLDPLRCYMRIASSGFQLHYKGRSLAGYDAVIPRIGASITRYGPAVLRQFELLGTYSPNPSDAILRARDQLRPDLLVAAQGMVLPVTGFGDIPDDPVDLLSMLVPPPHVIKLNEGAQGAGVMLTEKPSASRSVVEALAERVARGELDAVWAHDVRPVPAGRQVPGVHYEVQDVRAPKAPKPLPKALGVDDAVRLAEHEQPNADPWLEARDAAIVELLYGCGLRVGELVGLDAVASPQAEREGRGWVDLQAGEAHVFGKGSKRRSVPVGRAAVQALQAWLALRAQPFGGAAAMLEGALFVGQRGKRLTAQSVWLRWRG